MWDKKLLYYFSLLGQTGFTIAACIMIAVGIYKLIEKIIGQNGFVFIVMVLMGVAAGFAAVYRMVRKEDK